MFQLSKESVFLSVGTNSSVAERSSFWSARIFKILKSVSGCNIFKKITGKVQFHFSLTTKVSVRDFKGQN